MYEPNVTLVDVGMPFKDGKLVEGKLAIRVHVRNKLRGSALEEAVARGLTSPVPADIRGIPTDVIEARYTLSAGNGLSATSRTSANPRSRFAVLEGGISISQVFANSAGTLGCLVVDPDGAPMILSNWHVLARSWRTLANAPICQPGRLDGGDAGDTIASWTRDAMKAGLDAAVATLNGSRPIKNDQLGLGPVSGVGTPAVGMIVAKAGRTTQVTRGRITGIGGQLRIPYDGIPWTIQHVISIDPLAGEPYVTQPGDSGSLHLEDASKEALGLHFAGDRISGRALAMDINPILSALDVAIVTDPAVVLQATEMEAAIA
ncbi:MAG: hypothetical protein U0822_22340 [Anaerolineae bacterium]